MVAENKEDFIRMTTEAGEVLFCGMTDWKQVSGTGISRKIVEETTVDSVLFIRDTVKMRLVLSLIFAQFQTSFVPYLSLNFTNILGCPLSFHTISHLHLLSLSFFVLFRLCLKHGGVKTVP